MLKFEAGVVQELHVGEGLVADAAGNFAEVPAAGGYSPAKVERAYMNAPSGNSM